MRILVINYGGEYMVADEQGNISRPSIGMHASGQWRITGAQRLNNFSRVVESYSLECIFDNAAAIQWKHKNGTQCVHICDTDHGTFRMWGSPTHSVTVLEGASAEDYLRRVWHNYESEDE